MYVPELIAEIAPSNRSPFVVVVALPLFADELVPCAAAVTSSGFDVATPEYSKTAKRKVSEIVSLTVTVFAPPATFAA